MFECCDIYELDAHHIWLWIYKDGGDSVGVVIVVVVVVGEVDFIWGVCIISIDALPMRKNDSPAIAEKSQRLMPQSIRK